MMLFLFKHYPFASQISERLGQLGISLDEEALVA